MKTMTFDLDGKRSAYKPGERVEGQVSWELPEPPRSLELRLFWTTSGRGDEDQEIVATEPVPSPAATGWMRFSFLLPAGPCSFSGRLVSLGWALELVAPHEEMAASVPIVVGPEGREVRIDGEPGPEPS